MNLVPQIGFFEIIVVAVIALIVVGPKDLPKLMRMAGKAFAQARRMAAEFTAAFDQMARETEMEEMRQQIEALKRENPLADAKRSVEEAIQPAQDMLRDETNEIRDAINRPPSPATEAPAE